MDQKDALILLPTYNEKENVRIIIPELFSLYPKISILVIDDNSPDGTADEVGRLMSKYEKLKIMNRQEKSGLGDAYKAGIQFALEKFRFKAIVTMDADGSHDPEYVRGMLDKLDSADLVVGSRYCKGGGVESWEFWRKNLSRFGNLYSKILVNINVGDLTAGFVAVKRKILEKINFGRIGSSGYAYQIEFKNYCVKKCGAQPAEVPIVFKSRREGESKMSSQIISEGVMTPLKIFIKSIFKR